MIVILLSHEHVWFGHVRDCFNHNLVFSFRTYSLKSIYFILLMKIIAIISSDITIIDIFWQNWLFILSRFKIIKWNSLFYILSIAKTHLLLIDLFGSKLIFNVIFISELLSIIRSLVNQTFFLANNCIIHTFTIFYLLILAWSNALLIFNLICFKWL